MQANNSSDQNDLQACVGAGALALDNNQILLVKVNYGQAKNQWILPGGFVDKGENPMDAAIRELKEETGLDGKIVKPLAVRFRQHPADIYWVFQVVCDRSQAIKIQESEIVEARFWDISEALESKVVRPMTKVFIKMALDASTPPQVPAEYQKDHFVFHLR